MYNFTTRKWRTGFLLSIAGALLFASHVDAQTFSNNQTGTNNGFYYSLWSNGQGYVSMTLGSAGNYSVNWSNIGDFTAGKGWSTGSGHTISYNAGVYQNSGGGSLAIYGWTTNPLVEYYIAEQANGLNQGTYMGSYTSDGATYNIYKHQQVNQPSIVGTATFWQYISVRQSPRTSGTITIQNHFNAWASHGMNLGQQNMQIMLTEGWNGSGQSNVTVWEGGSGGGGGGSSSSSSSSGGGGGGGGGAPSGNVIMRARNSGSCVDAAGSGNGSNVQQYACWGGSNQSWTFVSVGNGYYEIKGVQSGRCLDVVNQSTADGANVQLYDCWAGNNQQWSVAYANDGTGNAEIINRNSGKCLDVSGSSNANGANIQQYSCGWSSNQQFKFN
ncbi:MAG: glycoside hydrolase family 11 protein [Steroidobacter sp.]